ncbi:MAG: hypothetical protein IKS37_01800 [Solobacterium sp.]|nr:hypothetical protein [Solobacterium sp.]
MEHRKKYIEILVHIDRDGNATPKEILWEDGRRFLIQKVLDKRHAITSSGGAAICHVCIIAGKRREIYKEKERWYVLTQ